MDGVVGFRREELSRLRAERHLTLDALATAVGVSDRSRVSLWETGTECPQPATLTRLARCLGVHPIELLHGGAASPTMATLRSAAGLTRGQAAHAVGMSRPAYLRLDAGTGRRDLPAGLLADLADAFGVEQRVVLDAHARSRATPGPSEPPTLARLRRPRPASEAAAALGITERSWYRLESGMGRRVLPPDWAARLAELFDVDTDTIHAAFVAGQRARPAISVTRLSTRTRR